MNLGHIHQRIEQIRASDAEEATDLEDALALDVFRAIADGRIKEPAEAARIVAAQLEHPVVTGAVEASEELFPEAPDEDEG